MRGISSYNEKNFVAVFEFNFLYTLRAFCVKIILDFCVILTMICERATDGADVEYTNKGKLSEMFDLPEGFPYLYETHMHTKEASACAKESAIDMVRAYKKAGYRGLFVTNHNWGGNTCVDRGLCWREWIDKYFEPYYRMKEWGDKNDFDVFCGMETGYGGPEFLIYGLEPEFWYAHPELLEASIEDQYKIIHEGGGLVIHAHPMRRAWYIDRIELFPDYVDGVEGLNASHSSPYSQSHNNKEYNDEALLYAKEHNFIITGGSDCHSVNILYGGMAFRRCLADGNDFCNILRKYMSLGNKEDVVNKEYDYLVTDAVCWYTPYGDVLR